MLGISIIVVFSVMFLVNGQSPFDAIKIGKPSTASLAPGTSTQLEVIAGVKKKAEPFNYPVALVGLGSFFVERQNITSIDSLDCTNAESLPVDSREACYSRLAAQNGSLDYCYKITQNASLKDKCFWDLAEKQDKLAYCNLINDASLKQACIADLQ